MANGTFGHIVKIQFPSGTTFEESTLGVRIPSHSPELIYIKVASDDIIDENEQLQDPYRLTHFRNIHAFYLDHLATDITAHAIVPRHRCIRKSSEIQKILKRCNATISQLPIILRKDPMAKCLRLAPGDICEITRNSSVGETTIYRVCV